MTFPPPSFAEARNRRQRVRAAGLSPDHWYPVEYETALARGRVIQVTFWGTRIALYRAAGGAVHALEDRCAHRQLPLSLGAVTDGCLTCPYHGWSYGADGRLVRVPHELFGHPMPSVRVRAYPVRLRYGLVWIFPGDPELAASTPMPELPEREGSDPWAYVPLSFTWRTHHSMVIDNLCDLTHAHLHRRYPAFRPGRLLDVETSAQRVLMRYEAHVGPLHRRRGSAPQPMTIAYDYPYHWARFAWSGMTGHISYWTFLLPIDRATTRVFFMFSYDTLRIPWLPLPIGHRLMTWVLRLADRPIVRPLLGEDGFALEAEQAGYDAHWDAPVVELNPVVSRLHDLTIREWQTHLARTDPVPDEIAVAT
jgi:phenylpropionate dioxygenase-like ring-hydroxylating dioxygenase large terminal subunit